MTSNRIASSIDSKLVLNEMVLLLLLDFHSADRVRVRVPPKAEYEYEKPAYFVRNRIEGTGNQRKVLFFLQITHVDVLVSTSIHLGKSTYPSTVPNGWSHIELDCMNRGQRAFGALL